MGLTFELNPIVAGEIEAELLVSAEPLSFWGGYDFETGTIIDQRHQLFQQSAAGRILVVPFTRGSSTTTAVLLEAINAGTAPAAIITTELDTFFALASVVGDEMYQRPIPLFVLESDQINLLKSGQKGSISAENVLTIQSE